ncbi:hypothetical protein SAMN05216235_0849 [Salinicoccus halodurans]|uniref:Uncharacterized protein n=1 Tax=Salinicoccus halodurans TaxID=407035 RepID=A0AA94HDD1_9STAP|nr:hypothetical protein SAMN05216235_0849 [Salinicoccus halodurans]
MKAYEKDAFNLQCNEEFKRALANANALTVTS